MYIYNALIFTGPSVSTPSTTTVKSNTPPPVPTSTTQLNTGGAPESTPTTTQHTVNPNSEGQGSQTATIAGAAVGGLVVVAVIAAIVIILMRYVYIA